MSKPNCRECKYAGAVPGDAHICCRHPGTSTNPWDVLSETNAKALADLGIRGDSYGIRSGWFFWPVNFDPVWLLECNGFEAAA